MRGERAWGDGSASGMHGKGPTQGCGGQGTRGAHVEHAAHGRDLGRVEAERLVERRRPLPSRKAGMRCGKRCGPGGVRALGGDDANGMCTGMARLKAGGQGTRGAHLEHALHGRDLGRVEAERLVELVRALPSRRAGMRCGKRYGPGGVWALGGGKTIGMHGEEQDSCRLGGAGKARSARRRTCGPCRDLGRVEALAERLVERRCALPSRSLRSNVTGLFIYFLYQQKRMVSQYFLVSFACRMPRGNARARVKP